jgi:hypothetical protein
MRVPSSFSCCRDAPLLQDARLELLQLLHLHLLLRQRSRLGSLQLGQLSSLSSLQETATATAE